jgi:hypothetical protein
LVCAYRVKIGSAGVVVDSEAMLALTRGDINKQISKQKVNLRTRERSGILNRFLSVIVYWAHALYRPEQITSCDYHNNVEDAIKKKA